eukprot:TRINITY_DN6253_c0_g1_i10.p1 TRINITY_DN6253_c0_g1~~TRINITY_DN6253_c0_g1_i10.p1  ORF type:complete len:297 (-),score=58.49 TRINITY_DN6253_c0_g1_i10:1024-1914(-)
MGVQDESSSEDQGLGWGKSLPVESVQEIVRKDSRNIPHRYIREDVDRPKDTDLYPLQLEIPLIDFSLLSSDKDEREKLHQACKEWGFFQITNHGIAEDVLQRMKAAAAAFFELPLEEKKMYSMASNDLQGYGQAYVVSEQQKLDWSDILFLMTLPIKDRKLNYWPTRVTSFMEVVDAYSKEINRVAKELFANLSLMMNMGKETLQRLHGEMKQAIRLNYYPICSRPELVLGVSPHSDCSTMSLLLQDDEVSALQIQHEGHWVPIEPIPRALVVNVGDIFEVTDTESTSFLFQNSTN